MGRRCLGLRACLMGVVNGNRMRKRRSWTGVAPPSPPVQDADTVFDPFTASVSTVLDYVDHHPEERARVLAAEQAGKARVTLLHALTDE